MKKMYVFGLMVSIMSVGALFPTHANASEGIDQEVTFSVEKQNKIYNPRLGDGTYEIVGYRNNVPVLGYMAIVANNQFIAASDEWISLPNVSYKSLKVINPKQVDFIVNYRANYPAQVKLSGVIDQRGQLQRYISERPL